MALQRSYTDIYGTTHAQAYTRVLAVHLGKMPTFVEIVIHASANARSKADATAEKAALFGKVYELSSSDATTYFADGVLDNDGVSPIKKAYEWLKTQNDTESVINWTTGNTDV